MYVLFKNFKEKSINYVSEMKEAATKYNSSKFIWQI